MSDVVLRMMKRAILKCVISVELKAVQHNEHNENFHAEFCGVK